MPNHRSRYGFWIVLVGAWLEVLAVILSETLVAAAEGHLAHVPRSLLLAVGMAEGPLNFILAWANRWSHFSISECCFVIVVEPTRRVSRVPLH